MSHQHDTADAHHSGHGHSDHGHSDHHDEGPKGYRPHHDWKVWVAVIWMLIGMAFYVLSGDEQLGPRDGGEEPAAAASAE